MSLDMSKYGKSEWLHGEDLPLGQPIEVTVQKVYEHTFERDNTTRPVVEYYELDGKMSLNKTQVRTLLSMFGPDAGAWIGQRVTLTAVMNGGFQGKPTIAIGRAAPPAVPTVMGLPVYQTPAQPGPAMTYQTPPQAPQVPHVAAPVAPVQPAAPVYQVPGVAAPMHPEVQFQTAGA